MNDLRKAAQQALEALEKATRFMSDSDYKKLNQAIDDLRAALVEPEQEPVAWRYELATALTHVGYGRWETRISDHRPEVPAGSIRRVTPLFTAPTPRKPLTDEQIVTMYAENPSSDAEMIEFARAIERAHGIGGGE